MVPQDPVALQPQPPLLVCKSVEKKITLRGRLVKKDLLDRILSAVNAGRPRKDTNGTIEIVRTNKSILSEVKFVLKLGLEPFDEATGSLPFGRTVEVFGLEQSGKTALVMLAALSAQARNIYEIVREKDKPVKYVKIPENSDVSVLYVDNECAIDDDEKIVINGVTIDGLLARCDTVDQMFKIIDITLAQVHSYETETKRRQFVVIVVDTVAGTSSREEYKQEWGKEDYPRTPKMLRQGFRIMTRRINRYNVLALMTNQVGGSFNVTRDRGGLPKDSDYESPGGKALKYYASLRIFMFKHPMTYKLHPSHRFADGLLIGFFTSKNRRVKPYREGRLVLLFEGGYTNVYSILETLIFLGLAKIDKESHEIAFRFKASGIDFASDKPVRSSREDDDDANEEEKMERGNPRIGSRIEWPEFYDAHREECMKLWDAAKNILFGTERLSVLRDAIEEDEEEDDV